MEDTDDHFAAIEHALKRSAAALRDAGVDFLLAGGMAVWARGGPASSHDLDLAVRPDDAERALDALEHAGLRNAFMDAMRAVHGL
jgi:hypothetical protein